MYMYMYEGPTDWNDKDKTTITLLQVGKYVYYTTMFFDLQNVLVEGDDAVEVSASACMLVFPSSFEADKFIKAVETAAANDRPMSWFHGLRDLVEKYGGKWQGCKLNED